MSGQKRKKWKELISFNNCLQPSFKELLNKSHPLKGKWKSTIFNNNHPIILEVGCGKGEYSVSMAEMFPEKNFIGIDIKGNRIWKGAKKAYEKKLTNIYFLRTRIDFITSLFDIQEVQEIWITFPDPQPKKEKKRLTSTIFLKKYQEILAKDGIIHLKTDSYPLYLYSKEIVENNFLLIHSAYNIYENLAQFSEQELKILKIKTYYENLFSEKGHKISYLSFKSKLPTY